MKVSVWGTLLFLAWSPLVAVTDGCSSQHEGERCDKTNGDADCEAGLYCKQVYVQRYYYICCPVPPALATVSTCNASGGPAPPVSDGGTDAEVSDDADNDADGEDDATTQTSSASKTNTNSAATTPAAY